MYQGGLIFASYLASILKKKHMCLLVNFTVMYIILNLQEPLGLMTQNMRSGPYAVVVDGMPFISNIPSLPRAFTLLIGIAELSNLTYPKSIEDFCTAVVKYVFKKNISVHARLSTAMQKLKCNHHAEPKI